MNALSLLFLLLLFSHNSYAQRVNTQDYWKCTDRVGGTWNFGSAPRACAANVFISDNLVNSKFSAYIFDEKKNKNQERPRYVTEIFHLSQQTAEYYIKKRKPNVSAAELRAWKEAVAAITHQESVMTHYRKGQDSKLRMMRGDVGHGHGLMQIDDRWHFAEVNKGKAANLIDNLFYALDIFYRAWQSAPSKSCVRSSTDYYNRTRAAYGIYNGGGNSACRFLNPNAKFARNDINFKGKLDNRTWNKFLSKSRKPTSVNIACLSNNSNSSCGTTPPPVQPPSPEQPVKMGKVLKYRDYLCALQGKSYHCISQPEKRFCLVNKYNLINEVVKTIAVKPVVLLSSEDVCENPNDLLAVGNFVKLKKNINLRETPGGFLQKTLTRDDQYQVLDVFTIEARNNARYYLIKSGSTTGYFYAGDESNHREWAVKTNSAADLVLPVQGTRIVVVSANGTNLRLSPGGDLITRVPKETELRVLGTVFAGETNKFYIEIEYKGNRGFLYSGQIHPNNSIKNWIEIL